MGMPALGWFSKGGRKPSHLRYCMISGAAALAVSVIAIPAVSTFVFAERKPVDPAFQDPTLTLSPSVFVPKENLDDDLGIDLTTTGSINPLSRSPFIRGSGEDFLQPMASRYRVIHDRNMNGKAIETGSLLPDLPQPVVIGAPDIKIMIGARLLGDETVLESHLPRGQRDAIIKVYEARSYAPFWVENGEWNAAARAVFGVLNEAPTHGLSPERYIVPSIASGHIQALADADIRLSIAIATYARDAQGARLNRKMIGELAMPRLDLPSAELVLEAVSAGADKAGEILAAYQPSARGYRALRAKLIALQRFSREHQQPATDAPAVHLLDKPMLKLGSVPLIRARLGLSPMDDPETAQLYDNMLAEAVASLQRQQAIPEKSHATHPTVLALAGSTMHDLPARPADIARLESAILVNMERWRWLPHDLGERHVMVNLPEQDVKVLDSGNVIQRQLGIVGRAETPTPIFSDKIQYITLNPTWNVPKSIVESEIVPGMMRDIKYAQKHGYNLTRKGKTTIVRQPPGVHNALGQVKFVFPNDMSIYLHDTPNRHLFKRDMRALSHGCVRVDEPLKLAETVLGNNWTETRIKKLIDNGEERSLRLEKPMPIHITYFTLAIDASGKTVSFPDLYRYDQRIKDAFDTINNQPLKL